MPFQSNTHQRPLSGIWTTGKQPSCAITPNNFVYKSLSQWALNVTVGCGHGCLFCYVPSTSTNKLGPKLATFGVQDPDSEWGDYVFVRPWDENVFLRSLHAAENTPANRLKPDGNRAVLLCSTTDAFQIIRHPDPQERAKLQEHLRFVVRRSLELIRDHSSLNVRILTRSPLVREDFDLLTSFGNRVLLGMSIPTLRNDLAKIYEPKAPAPSVRLETLRAAAKVGIPVFAAVAPTYAECDEDDLRTTLSAIAALRPTTVFHEPINVRAENITRIQTHARELGVELRTDVFDSKESWQSYALLSLHTVERIAGELGLEKQLHLWPDKSLGTQAAFARLSSSERDAHRRWLNHWWSRVSAWPTNALS